MSTYPSEKARYNQNFMTDSSVSIDYGSTVEYRHHYPLYGYCNRGAEVQGVYNGVMGEIWEKNDRIPKTGGKEITIDKYHKNSNGIQADD